MMVTIQRAIYGGDYMACRTVTLDGRLLDNPLKLRYVSTRRLAPQFYCFKSVPPVFLKDKDLSLNLTKNRFFYLLLALLTYFVANPFLIESRMDSYVLGIFFTLILIGSLYVIGKERWLLIMAIILASLAFIAQWSLAGFFLAPVHVFIVYMVTIVFFMVMIVVVMHFHRDFRYTAA